MTQSTLQTAKSRGLNVVLAGTLLAGTGVALGAFGAHALKASLTPDLLADFETGVRYQMYHGLGLMALGLLPSQRRAPAFLLAGTIIFSGSLYLLALTGQQWLGAVTPIGGVLQLVGWGLAAWEARRR